MLSTVLLALLPVAVGSSSADNNKPTKCSCANATLCLPLAHGPPPHADVHVWSDCGGPWQSFYEPGNCAKHPGPGCNSSCNWRDLDFSTITTLGRDVGHSLGVRADGGVSILSLNEPWPDSDVVCHAHSHDVRVVAAVHPYLDQIYPKSARPHDPCFYQHLLANSTAHSRLAAELVDAIRDSGMDGVEFDFEGIDHALVANCSPGFDYGAAHVAMITTVTEAFHSSLPHSTVTLTMGGCNISDTIHAQYLSVYPVPGLAEASDGIFIMGYDMNHHHLLCADANSPLDVLRGNVQSYIDLGAEPSKLILGIPWYGYMKRCNDSIPKPSSFPQCADTTCLVGDAENYDHSDYAMGVWAVEELLANTSSGCVRSWSEERGSPFMDCPASSLGPYPPFRLAPPPGKQLRTQTWYDDANSTRLKTEMAKSFKLGGVGAFTGENVGPPSNGWSKAYWRALTAIKTDDSDITAAPAVVSLTHSLVKLRPDETVPASATIRSIAASRNEYTSFQVAIAVPPGGHGATVAGIDVAFPGTLDPSALLVHRAHYINISIVSNCAGGLGRWPDALIPEKDVYDGQTRSAFPAPVAAGTNQAFWVDVFVKNGTAPGLHSGSVTVRLGSSSSESAVASRVAPTVLPLDLKVHKFTLPSISRYMTTYNCNSKAIIAGRMQKGVSSTRAQRVEWQKQYVDLGLMHRVSFSDFLKADEVALGLPVPPGKATPVDWEATEKAWGRYLGSDGAGLIQTQFGLGETRPTTIYLPAMHYPGPYVGTPPNHTLIDELWHATGCTKPTPTWGYAYWSSQGDYGVRDMLTYCDHCAEGRWDRE